MPQLIIAVAILTAPVGAIPTPKVQSSQPQVAALQCGAGSFELMTRRVSAATGDVRQFFSVEARRSRHALPLDDTALDNAERPPAYVSSWACVATSRAHYLMLGYACSDEDDADKRCGGEREWVRVLDDRGRRLDHGFPRQGPRYTSLYARLGLSAITAKGVAMTPVVPD